MNLIIELPDDEVKALRKIAERLGVSAEAYARQVLERDLKEHRLSRAPRHISQVIAEVMAGVPLEDFAKLPAKFPKSQR
jgi:plasmid stability protein